jgi:hypothetical protein
MMTDTTREIVTESTRSSDSSARHSGKQSARSVREAWMRMMGLSEQEIAEHCIGCPPVDLDEELDQYNAMLDIKELNQET